MKKRPLKSRLGIILPFVRDLYLKRLMADKEIQLWIKEEHGILVSRQAISRMIKKYIGRRKRDQSNKVRAITGRMDYEKVKSKIDYINRKIDYREIAYKRSPDFHGPLKNPKTKQVSLPQPYVDRIREYAKAHGKTISDTLREILPPTIVQYQKYILRPLEQSLKPYFYNKEHLKDMLDAFLGQSGW